MKKIRTLIVDDEPDARALMKASLSDFSEMELVGESSDGQQAIEAIQNLSPDVVFLDIEMPEMNGFEVVKHLVNPMPYIVFVTAYNDFAIQAFEVNAIDYILKPYTDRRLKSAFERARHSILKDELHHFTENYKGLLISMTANKASVAMQDPFLQKFAVKTASRTLFVDAQDVVWIEASDQYVQLHTVDNKYLLRDSMDRLEKAMDPEQFFRCHRSSIVNVHHVVAMDQLDGKHTVLIMKQGAQVKMTNTRKEEFRRLMGW